MSAAKKILAIASGKGGVGKSTVTTQFALALKKKGFRVGLLDADIYGPSLVHMTGAAQPDQMDSSERIIPPTVSGIPVISSAMFMGQAKAQILRGPMAGNMVKQLFFQVAWPELDYLLIDYPPGTGDIQLSLGQSIPFTGAILVTTPQEVSLLDVKKSAFMFETLKTPILGIVETMSYFVCDGCTKKHELYPRGNLEAFAKDLQVPILARVPFLPQLAQAQDQSLGLEKLFPDYDSAVSSLLDEPQRGPRGSAPLDSFSLTWQNT